MSLGNKLMGLFIETNEAEEGNPPAQAPAATNPAAPSRAPDPRTASKAAPVRTPASQSVSIPAPASTGSGEADPALMEALRKTIQEHNQPGFDYLEFEGSLNALASVIPDEAIRFRSAFATAAVQGLTLDVLLKTAQSYRDVLVQERTQFENDLKSKADTDITKRNSDIDNLTKDIQAKADQVKRLTDEIAAAQDKQQKLQAQAQKAAAALDRARSRFLASLSAIDDEIAQNQSKIKSYLGGA